MYNLYKLLQLQEQLGCVIGQDYPAPIVDHDKARVENLRKMDAAYKNKKNSAVKEEGKQFAFTCFQ